MSSILTLGQVAKHFGIEFWKVARLYEKGLLTTPHRVGTLRVVGRRELPKIGRALRNAGYLPEAVAEFAKT